MYTRLEGKLVPNSISCKDDADIDIDDDDSTKVIDERQGKQSVLVLLLASISFSSSLTASSLIHSWKNALSMVTSSAAKCSLIAILRRMRKQ